MVEQQENWKFIVVLLGAGLTFMGGVLTFLNGRLKEAEDATSRKGVWFVTIGIAAMACNGAAFILYAISAELLIWTALLFAVSYGLASALFLKLSGPIRRRDIVVFGVLTATMTAAVTLAIAFYFFESFLGLIEHFTTVLEKSSSSK